MDPADLEPVRHAVASQGAVLDLHSHALKDLLSGVQELTARVADLQLQAQPLPPSVPNPSLVVSPGREPWVSPPERYEGNLGQCKTFLMQCGLVFDLQPQTYSTDKAKIAYVISLLRGEALEWASVHWRKQDQVTTSFTTFVAEMSKVFDHPVQGKDASMRLLSLRQGSRSVAEYAIEFRTLATESGWNMEAQQAVFCNGLSEILKDELVSYPEPNDVDELIALSIRIDNRCRERRRERRRTPVTDAPSRLRGHSPAPLHVAQPHNSVFFQGTEQHDHGEVRSGEEPMQLGRNRLSPQERARRMAEYCCLYCGKPGHVVANCPTRTLNRRAR